MPIIASSVFITGYTIRNVIDAAVINDKWGVNKRGGLKGNSFLLNILNTICYKSYSINTLKDNKNKGR